MVQQYHSPVRVYKYPFELVMRVSIRILILFVNVCNRRFDNVTHHVYDYDYVAKHVKYHTTTSAYNDVR